MFLFIPTSRSDLLEYSTWKCAGLNTTNVPIFPLATMSWRFDQVVECSIHWQAITINDDGGKTSSCKLLYYSWRWSIYVRGKDLALSWYQSLWSLPNDVFTGMSAYLFIVFLKHVTFMWDHRTLKRTFPRQELATYSTALGAMAMIFPQGNIRPCSCRKK